MKILCIQTRAPFNGFKAEEAQEMIMAMASFGYQIQLLFCGAGVTQLVPTTPAPERKAFTKAYGALGLYDIEEVYVCEQSLGEHQLSQDDLTIDCQSVNDKTIAELFRQAQMVWTF